MDDKIVTTDNNYYSNYMERVPSDFGKRLLRIWHSRLLKISEVKPIDGHRRLLEFGPGHGWFAQVASSAGWQYEFEDISTPVALSMQEKGYTMASSTEFSAFDVVWASHVLEHAKDPSDARELVRQMKQRLREGGILVIISPDYMSWGKHFFDVDATHGYPTTLRTVTQLVKDVGLEVISARTHRCGGTGVLRRCLSCLLTTIPTTPIDFFLSPGRWKFRDGPFASWKAVFGWRQVLIVALRDGKNS